MPDPQTQEVPILHGQVGKSSPNLLARDFEAEDPMTKLVTDVTEFKVGGTKLYLSPVVDLYKNGRQFNPLRLFCCAALS